MSIGFSRQNYWSGLPVSFVRGSSQLRDPTFISHVSCIGRRVFSSLAPPEKSQQPVESESESCIVMSDSLRPNGLYSPWNSLGQITGVGSLSLLQGIFLIQGLNPGLLHCRQILYQLSRKGSFTQYVCMGSMCIINISSSYGLVFAV